MTKAYQRPDQELSYYGEKFTQACKDLLEQMPLKERLRINLVILDLVDRLHEQDPKSTVTFEDALTLVMSVFYFARFNQSPVQTAIFTRERKELD